MILEILKEINRIEAIPRVRIIDPDVDRLNLLGLDDKRVERMQKWGREIYNDADCSIRIGASNNDYANVDDSTCVFTILGCTDATAFNYSSIANTDDNSCYQIKEGCLDLDAYNYNDGNGDGVADVNINDLVAFHKAHGKEATLTATYPPGRFGALEIINNEVRQFQEKPRGDGALINGGYFVLSPKVFNRIDGDASVWEQEPLKGLASDGELMSFKHDGFWQPMDTLRDKMKLNDLLDQNKAPWKVWK